jgi:hypothetical protein
VTERVDIAAASPSDKRQTVVEAISFLKRAKSAIPLLSSVVIKRIDAAMFRPKDLVISSLLLMASIEKRTHGLHRPNTMLNSIGV